MKIQSIIQLIALPTAITQATPQTQ